MNTSIEARLLDYWSILTTVTFAGCFDRCVNALIELGSQSKNLLRTIQRLLRTAPARSSEHKRECAPAWIPRNGNDSKAMPYVVLTCAECLRAFSMNLVEGTSGQVLEIPCRSCHNMNRYIIQPSNYFALEVSA